MAEHPQSGGTGLSPPAEARSAEALVAEGPEPLFSRGSAARCRRSAGRAGRDCSLLHRGVGKVTSSCLLGRDGESWGAGGVREKGA